MKMHLKSSAKYQPFCWTIDVYFSDIKIIQHCTANAHVPNNWKIFGCYEYIFSDRT